MNRNWLFFSKQITGKSLFGASTVPERELYFGRLSKSGFSRERETHSREKHETKIGDCDSGPGADMVVKLEAGLNAARDHTSEFVTQREKRGTGHV